MIAPGFPKAVRDNFRRTIPGKTHADRDSILDVLLGRMKAAIDEALED